MIPNEILDAFHELIRISEEPCSCNDENPCCRGCNARECLEEIASEVSEILEDIKSE
jgi:hypothetical protein